MGAAGEEEGESRNKVSLLDLGLVSNLLLDINNGALVGPLNGSALS